MKIGVTGHRPNKLAVPWPAGQARLTALAAAALRKHAPELVWTGMARGWDTAVALACRELAIPYAAAVPFAGQEAAWPLRDLRLYAQLLDAAAEVQIVCEGGPAHFKYQRRNEFIVDHCDLLLALWNEEPNGGTYNCLRYAQQRQRPVVNLWASWVKYKDKEGI